MDASAGDGWLPFSRGELAGFGCVVLTGSGPARRLSSRPVRKAISRRRDAGQVLARTHARRVHQPAQIVVAGFAAAVMVSTSLLLLPIARAGEGGATFLEALFTATSAVCVTGLVVVDTASYWSGFGEAVILASIQIGGFGIMTFASLLGLLIARRMGLRSRLTTAAETKTIGIGDVRSVLIGVAKVSLIFESITAAFSWGDS